MKQFKNRPVITTHDHPEVIAEALRESIPWYNRHLPGQADAWIKTACDSYETVENDFLLLNPELAATVPEDKESIVYMSPDQLELALVIHGVKHVADAAEVHKVDELLASIDELRSQK